MIWGKGVFTETETRWIARSLRRERPHKTTGVVNADQIEPQLTQWVGELRIPSLKKVTGRTLS